MLPELTVLSGCVAPLANIETVCPSRWSSPDIVVTALPL